jgi:hypothetical protein
MSAGGQEKLILESNEDEFNGDQEKLVPYPNLVPPPPPPGGPPTASEKQLFEPGTSDDTLAEIFTVDAGEMHLYGRREDYYNTDAPALSSRGRIMGVIRFVWGYFFTQAILLGIAIALGVVFKVSYLIARSNQKEEFDAATVIWVSSLPIIMIVFAMLVEDGIGMLLDTIKHSPFDEVNSLNRNIRYKFIYLITGGERPTMLDLRASIVAILSAVFVRPAPLNKCDPLVVPPDWIVLVSETVFYITFLIIPLVYTILFVHDKTMEYRFFSYTQALQSICVFVALVVVATKSLMNLTLLMWPRAARTFALVTGRKFAEYIMSPYIEDITKRPIVALNKSAESKKVCPIETTDIKRKSLQEWEDEVWRTQDVGSHNDEKQALADLMDVASKSHYNPVFNPRSIGALGSPTDVFWRKCCSKIKLIRFVCSHCCENTRWDDSPGEDKKGGCNRCWNRLDSKAYVLMAFLCYTVLLVLTFSSISTMGVNQVFMGLTVLCLGAALQAMCPALLGRAFYAILFIQVFFFLNMTSLASKSDATSRMSIENTPSWVTNSSSQTGWPSPAEKKLPICDLSFSNRQVSVLDLGILINSVYSLDRGEERVKRAFAGGPLADGVLSKKRIQGKGSDASQITWTRWDFNATKTSVYAIRGTSTALDVMQDTTIWSFVASLQMFTFTLPLQVQQELNNVVSNEDFRINAYEELVAEVETFTKDHPTGEWTTILTGHSLGGFYANLVAGLTHTPSFTFSAPGLKMVSKEIGIKDVQADLYSYVINIVPEYDPVPGTDKQVGTRVDIPCTMELTSISSIGNCHSDLRTLAMLVMACPDNTMPNRRWEIVTDNLGTDLPRVWYLGNPEKEDGQHEDIVKYPDSWGSRPKKID